MDRLTIRNRKTGEVLMETNPETGELIETELLKKLKEKIAKRDQKIKNKKKEEPKNE